MMRNLLIAAALFAGVGQSAPAPSAGDGDVPLYRITKVVGHPQAWPSLGAAWTSVAVGKRVTAGTLVSLKPGEALKVQGLKKTPGPDELDLRGPLLVRLEPEALRRIEIGQEVRARAQKNAPSKAVAVSDASFDEAWRRVKATFIGQQEPDDEKAASKPPEGTGIAGGLELFIPQKSVTLTPGKPVEMRLSWGSKNKPKSPFQIRIKRPGDEHAEKVETSLDHQYVQLDAPGIYVVEVATTDGSMRSIEHKIEVLQPVAEVVGEGDDPKPRGVLRLVGPPNGMRFAGLKVPASVAFSWFDVEGAHPEGYEVTVTTQKGVRIASARTAQMVAALTITRPGSYLWSVRRLGAADDAPVQSATANLTIEKDSLKSLSELFKSPSAATVYVGR